MTTTEKDKQPIIIRNPYLDGVGPGAKALRKGRSSLRIERGTPAPPATATPAPLSSVAGVRVAPTTTANTDGPPLGGLFSATGRTREGQLAFARSQFGGVIPNR